MREPRLPQIAGVHEKTVQKVAAEEVTPPRQRRFKRQRTPVEKWSMTLHPLLVDYIRAHPQYDIHIISEIEVSLTNPRS